jgi:hypothetical protein
MKSFWKILLVIVAVGGAIGGLIFAFLQGRQEITADAQADKPIAAPPDVKQTASGETMISLDQARQKLIGLKTVRVKSSVLSPGTKAYGRVLDPQPLVGLFTDIASARAALGASTQEYNRSKTLFDQGQNASAKSLQAANAAMKHDQIALEAARDQLMVGWGGAIDGQPNLDALMKSLFAHKTVLVQLDAPAGELINREPEGGRLELPGTNGFVAARFLGHAAATDHQVQGAGFLFIVTNGTVVLTHGQAVTGYLQLPGEPLPGVLVPDEAVVRWAGSSWIYAQTGETNFLRREIATDQPLGGGWFVTNGVAPNERVVITGAQVLLSEERKMDIKPAD